MESLLNSFLVVLSLEIRKMSLIIMTNHYANMQGGDRKLWEYLVVKMNPSTAFDF